MLFDLGVYLTVVGATLLILANLGKLSTERAAQEGQLMELLYALTLGLLTTCGVYLLLRARTFPVVVGLTLLSYAVNLSCLPWAGSNTGMPAVIGRAAEHADPLPQALVLTAIVIGFANEPLLLWCWLLRGQGELVMTMLNGKGDKVLNSSPPFLPIVLPMLWARCCC